MAEESQSHMQALSDLLLPEDAITVVKCLHLFSRLSLYLNSRLLTQNVIGKADAEL